MTPARVQDDEPNSILTDIGQDGITHITINRPHCRNAVNSATAGRLFQAFAAFEDDPAQKVCVFTGSNGTFCAGADLYELARSKKLNDRESSWLPAPVQGQNLAPMGPSRMQIMKPVICAVAGHAVAGGLELSLLADMRVAEEDAVFGVYCRRFGVPLIDGGTVRLQRIVGLGRALDMILTGRPVNAQEALSMGLANRVVPKGQGRDEAIAIARQLLDFPQKCMNADRDSCYYSAYGAVSMEDALRRETEKGVKIIEAESIAGASNFSGGEGRHGSFGRSSKL